MGCIPDVDKTGAETVNEKLGQANKSQHTERKKRRNSDIVEITINGQTFYVPNGLTILEACELSLQKINPDSIPPTFCSHPYLPHAKNYQGRCGICEVEDVKTGELLQSCKMEVKNGLSINTSGSQRIDSHIRTVLMTKLASHPLNCPACPQNGNCMFQDLLAKYEITPGDLEGDLKAEYMRACLACTRSMSASEQNFPRNNAVLFDPTKCVLCHRCIRVCEHVQGMSKRSLIKNSEYDESGVHLFRDIEEYHEKMFETDCIMCGQCSFVCPVGAIVERGDDLKALSKLLQEKRIGPSKNIIVVQLAPSARITLSEEFEFPPGHFSVNQIVHALKNLGFDKVFDTQFGADVTIIEESNEFVKRVQNGGPWPMFTSCCPAAVNFVEKNFPQYIPNLSTCKSPHQMVGALVKSYWAEQNKEEIGDRKIIVVSVMPCSAKKDEIRREGLKGDVDYCITVREFARMLKSRRIKVEKMSGMEFDSFLGESSGDAGAFATSGGVCCAILRMVDYQINGKKRGSCQEMLLDKEFGTRTFTLFDTYRATIIHKGAKQIRDVLLNLDKFPTKNHLIEMMSCPEGCLGGGGNPKFKVERYSAKKYLKHRKMALLNLKDEKKRRVGAGSTNENKSVKMLYDRFLKAPGSDIANRLLHTSFRKQ